MVIWGSSVKYLATNDFQLAATVFATTVCTDYIRSFASEVIYG
jgi:hypothetical protein